MEKEKEIYEMGKEIFNYLKSNFKVYTNEECKQLEKDEGAFGVIYMTQCKVNNKLYIGQKKIDRKDFVTYLGSGTLITKAVDKYGKDNFERIILEVAYSQEELNNFEIKYIRLFDASEKYNRDLFYNRAIGGGVIGLKGKDSPWYGKHHTEETRRKQSDGNRGKYVSEETRKKIGERNRGKYVSEETRKKQSEARRGENNPMYGKHRTEEARKKQSDGRKGKYIGENNPRAKLVVCIFPDGRIIKDVCIKELAEELEVTRGLVRKILNSHEPYKPTKKHLERLNGVIIIKQEDYLNIIKNKFSKAS